MPDLIVGYAPPRDVIDMSIQCKNGWWCGLSGRNALGLVVRWHSGRIEAGTPGECWKSFLVSIFPETGITFRLSPGFVPWFPGPEWSMTRRFQQTERLPGTPIDLLNAQTTFFAMTWVMQRIEASFFSGLGISLTLSIMAEVAVRLLPYRDKPMMPKLFFVEALSPGLLVWSWFSFGSVVGHFSYFLTNAIFCGVPLFCMIAIVQAGRRRSALVF